jgi:hypothetical protein
VLTVSPICPLSASSGPSRALDIRLLDRQTMSVDSSAGDALPEKTAPAVSSPSEGRKVTLLRRPADASPRQTTDQSETFLDAAEAPPSQTVLPSEHASENTVDPTDALDPALVSALSKIHERIFLLKLDEACERFLNDEK